MIRSNSGKFAAAFLLPLFLISVRTASAQAISIQNAGAGSNPTILSIAGTNFCASPAITLGGTALTVSGATSTLITANLPQLTAGTYYLVVSCGTLAGRTAYFDVTIGAAGSSSPSAAAGGCWVDGQRFADCGNGTVSDAMTGLIWLENADCSTLGTLGFSAANTAAAALHSGQCGLSDGSAAGDWRLPTRAEWLTMLQGAQGLIATFANNCPAPPLKANNGVSCFAAVTPGTAGNQHAFINVVSGGYWSSSIYELDPTYAYLVDLSQTNVANNNTLVPHFPVNSLSLNVWPVRGGSK